MIGGVKAGPAFAPELTFPLSASCRSPTVAAMSAGRLWTGTLFRTGFLLLALARRWKFKTLAFAFV